MIIIATKRRVKRDTNNGILSFFKSEEPEAEKSLQEKERICHQDLFTQYLSNIDDLGHM